MSTEHITIKAFRAVDDKAGCAEYLREHIRVLDDIGVTSVIKPDLSWCIEPGVIVVVAIHNTLGMVAGVRLHSSRSDKPLPLELLIKHLEPNLREKIDSAAPFGLVEIAGLWCAHRFSGRGLPILVTQAGIAVASSAGTSALLCFAAEYTTKHITDAGGAALASVGVKGSFPFPNETFTSTVLLIPDLLTLQKALPTVRQRILSLRLRGDQKRTEQPKHHSYQVTYCLVDEYRNFGSYTPKSSKAA